MYQFCITEGNMTPQDTQEFVDYLLACSTNQVRAVYRKERKAHRYDYAQLALTELNRRGETP